MTASAYHALTITPNICLKKLRRSFEENFATRSITSLFINILKHVLLRKSEDFLGATKSKGKHEKICLSMIISSVFWFGRTAG